MKDYPEGRREGLRGQGGFTLMEMLIVVAIIAVLIAIAIPVFTSQLNRAKASADAANIRSGYATATASVLSDNLADGKYGLNSDGTITAKDGTGTFTTQVANDKSYGIEAVAGQIDEWGADEHIYYTVSNSGASVSISAE